MRESYALLRKYGIPFSEPVYLKSEEDISAIRQYPVALKVVSDDIVHKSDVGGVILDIADAKATLEARSRILDSLSKKAPNAKVDSIVAFQMRSGLQLLVGMKRDPNFGPVIAFGLGGIHVEILKDVALHVGAPDSKQAFSMLSRIKAASVLDGARGQESVNKKAISDIIVRLGKLAEKEPEVVEVDLNPIIANSKDAVAVDVRVMVR
jgi:acyl-CoA synthetase (NDP forming)